MTGKAKPFVGRIKETAGVREYSDPVLFAQDLKREGLPRNRHGKRDPHPLDSWGQKVLRNMKLRKSHAAPRREWSEPQAWQPGAAIVLPIPTGTVLGQVWSLAPDAGVWVATDRGFYWVHIGSRMIYRRPEEYTYKGTRGDCVLGTAVL
jgi:hypothetical protein